MTSKTKLRFAAVVATFLFIASFWGANVTKAQCPTGYTERTVPMVINGCNYEVTLCVFCTTGPRPSDVVVQANKITMTSPPGCQTWNPNQVISYVYSQVKTYNFIHSVLCSNPLVPLQPCPTVTYRDTINLWRCWNAEVVEYFGNLYTVIRPCNYNEKCVEALAWCLGPDGFPVSTVTHPPQNPPVTYPLAPPTCSKLMGENVQWPIAVGQQTDCWWYKTSCDE